MIRNRFYIIIVFILLFLPLKRYAQHTPGTSYWGANNFIEYIAGNLPIIIIAPHGGTVNPDSLPVVNDRGTDNGTYETIFLLKDSLVAQTNGYHPHVIINHLHPSKMLASQDSTESAGTHPVAIQAWKDFHAYIDTAKTEVTNSWLKGHYFELHGNGHSDMWNEVGLGISPSQLNSSDSVIQSIASLTTVKNLATVEGADFLELVKGSTSLGGLLGARGWKSCPSPSYPSPGESSFYYAGWNTWKHGSKYGGTIDATHLEAYWEFMTSTNRNQFSGDLAESILLFMEAHYGFDFECPDIYDNAMFGSIVAHIDTKITNMPATSDGNDYVTPTSSQQISWRAAVQNIITADYCAANTAAAVIDYQVVEFTDTTTSPGIKYYILERASGATTNYWGTFVYNPIPVRSKLFIQSPHPLNDSNTGQEGLDIFRYTGALAFYTSGTHRCNSTVSSSCDGTTTTCSGSSESYRSSDQAHVTQGPMHIATEEMESAISDLIILQPHGFPKEESDPDLILSNGTQYTPTTDYLTSLKNNLTLLDSTLTYKVGHTDLSWTRLLGTTNMQGRFINGISSPCNTSSTGTTGNFLHVEQAYSNLRDNQTNWNKMVNAAAMTFPADNVFTNNRFLEFDGSNDYVVYPDDTNLKRLDGISDYTLEAWLYIENESDIDAYDVIFTRESSFMIQLRSDLRVSFRLLKSDSTWAYYNSSNNAITIGQWNHIAVIRDTGPSPNVLKIYANGIDVSGSWMGYNLRSDNGPLYIGTRGNGTNYLNGYIDEIRIKDHAEYPGNLRSSTSDDPYSWDGNTIALFHFDEGNGFVETNNEAAHWATLGDSDLGYSDEPTWRNWDYLQQNLPLPVQLISFNARILDANVQLNWTTSTEVDNYGFEITRLRSRKNRDYVDESWETLGFVEGHGNSNSPKSYSFTDILKRGTKFKYRLKQIDINGSFEYSEIIEVELDLPTKFELSQNYPNPFNPTTVINYSLPKVSDVTLRIYNTIGQEIDILVNEQQEAGRYTVTFNASNIASGIYIYRIETGSFSSVKKMMILK